MAWPTCSYEDLGLLAVVADKHKASYMCEGMFSLGDKSSKALETEAEV